MKYLIIPLALSILTVSLASTTVLAVVRYKTKAEEY